MANKRSFGDMTSDEIGGFTVRLREVVERIGSQAHAADVAGVSLAQLKNYLTGASSPPLIPMQRLVDAAGVDMAWLVHGEGAEAARFRAALNRGAELAKLVKAIDPLRQMYVDAGFAFRDHAEEDAVLGAAIDCVMTQPDMSMWPLLAKVVLEAQAAALGHASRVVARGSEKAPRRTLA